MNLVLVCVALLCLLGVCIDLYRGADLEARKLDLERDLEAVQDLLDAALRDEAPAAENVSEQDGDESPIAALERVALEERWKYDYWPIRGFDG